MHAKRRKNRLGGILHSCARLSFTIKLMMCSFRETVSIRGLFVACHTWEYTPCLPAKTANRSDAKRIALLNAEIYMYPLA